MAKVKKKSKKQRTYGRGFSPNNQDEIGGVRGPLGKKPGDSWIDAQGNLWIVDTLGRPVNLGVGNFPNLLVSKATPDGGGPTTTTDPASGIDFESLFGIYGLPADVIAEIRRIYNSTDDHDQATLLSVAFIRGTGWYAQTFPGIKEGFRLGIVGNERDYRSYTNTLNQIYRQYYGRDVAANEVAGWLTQGASPEIVGGHLGGEAWVKANEGDVQFYAGAFGEGRLSGGELQSLGEQKAGLQNTQGGQLDVRLEKAFSRARSVFEGVLANPGLSLQGGRLSAPGLSAGSESDTGR
jgi:hypothetical protein